MALQTLFMPGIAQGRLTLASGTPVTTTDQTAKTTVYFTPYKGNLISLYDGANWAIIPFSEVSVAVPSTLFKCFDVFGYLSSGALAIECLDWTQTTGTITAATNATPVVVTSAGHGLSVGNIVGIASMAGLTSLNTALWTITAVATDTFTLGSSAGNGVYTSGGTWYKIANTRATALVATTGGVYTKSGDATRFYLGTGITTGTSGQCESSLAKQFLWNYYNQVSLDLQRVDDTWSYASTTVRQADANNANRCEFVIGVDGTAVDMELNITWLGAGGNASAIGIGQDSITAYSTNVGASMQILAPATNYANMLQAKWHSSRLAVGYHYLAWLESCPSAGSATFAIGANQGLNGYVLG